MADLRQVLPADQERGILRMLHDLREHGHIEKRGAKRGTRWHVAAVIRQPPPGVSDNGPGNRG
jgi:hypothetical protein